MWGFLCLFSLLGVDVVIWRCVDFYLYVLLPSFCVNNMVMTSGGWWFGKGDSWKAPPWREATRSSTATQRRKERMGMHVVWASENISMLNFLEKSNGKRKGSITLTYFWCVFLVQRVAGVMQVKCTVDDGGDIEPSWVYNGKYWNVREQCGWEMCPDIMWIYGSWSFFYLHSILKNTGEFQCLYIKTWYNIENILRECIDTTVCPSSFGWKTAT